jgi:hypothetical protein
MSEIQNIDDQLKYQVEDYEARVAVHIVDLSITADFGQISSNKLKASLIAKNLLDYYYVEYVGSLGPTRSLVFQLEFRL